MLAVAGEDQEEQRRDQYLPLMGGPDLVQCEPHRQAGQVPNDQGKDLPQKWVGWDQAGRNEEDRPEEWTKAAEGGYERTGA